MSDPLTVGSLFTGIGGFDLGLDRAGMKVIWQSEIDQFASKILKKHWPEVPNLGDIRSIRGGSVERPDLICGGFPCQPFSSASAGKAYGESHDAFLWPEMLRVISECRPTWVVGENVTHLDRMALEQVCSGLEACGYEVQTLEIPACAVDADHIRARLFILGHSNSNGEPGRAINAETPRMQGAKHEVRGVGKAHGISSRMDRMRALGNAVHVGVAEVIGRAIVSAHR